MPIPLTDVPAIAARLGDDALHVWRLQYDPRRGRAPLRALLGAYLGTDADAVALVEGPHGRPELAAGQAQALDFNWSHSGDCALVALGRRVAPGIDVERQRPRPRALEIAQRYFCPPEAQWLAALPSERQNEAFLALWTAKEAVLKALGRGLAFGLHRLQIGFDPGTPRLLRLEEDDPEAWQLRPLPVDTQHVASLAWRGPPLDVQSWVLAGAD
jgi:4'-phosphopantetheinyl transferase